MPWPTFAKQPRRRLSPPLALPTRSKEEHEQRAKPMRPRDLSSTCLRFSFLFRAAALSLSGSNRAAVCVFGPCSACFLTLYSLPMPQSIHTDQTGSFASSIQPHLSDPSSASQSINARRLGHVVGHGAAGYRAARTRARRGQGRLCCAARPRGGRRRRRPRLS